MSTSTGENTKTRASRAKATGTLVGTRFQDEALKQLDDWRREQPDIPGRSEAIRRLVEIGINGKPKSESVYEKRGVLRV